VSGMTNNEDDFTEYMLIGSTKDYLLLFTDQGRVFWLKVYEIPLASRTSKGRSINNLINLNEGEKILQAIPVKDFDERELIMTTATGFVKKTALSAYSHPKKRLGIIAIVLTEGDSLIDVALTTGKEDIVLTTKKGLSIRFNEEEVRSVGRASRGVRGMNLNDGDQIISMNIVDNEKKIMTICANGYGKKSSFDDYRCAHRGGKGVKTIANIERNGEVVRSLTIGDEDEILMMTQEGMVSRISTADFRVLGRTTSGVKIMRMKKEDDRIVSVVPMALGDEANDIPKEEAEGRDEEE
jgi:DNA gyrase subunit A